MDIVKLSLRKHPVAIGVKWLLPRKWGVWDVGGGFEVDIYQRKVYLYDEFDN
ncbi:MAG: hypothetical protein JXX29_10750 [Deltaproteobacteria bacterium]|nr:hypothetical protein [Deltaproteobacteria bacterium]MBN2672147.1 hypothetical protein [Deltaproteobacteria bacterium]